MGSLMAKERNQTQKPNSKLFHVYNIPETAKPQGEKSDQGLPGAGGGRGENRSQRDSREHLHMMEMRLRHLDRGAGEMNGIKIHQTASEGESCSKKILPEQTLLETMNDLVPLLRLQSIVSSQENTSFKGRKKCVLGCQEGGEGEGWSGRLGLADANECKQGGQTARSYCRTQQTVLNTL